MRAVWLAVPAAAALVVATGLSRLGSGVRAPVAGAARPHPEEFFQRWCLSCHDDETRKGKLSLADATQVPDSIWTKVRSHVLLRTMPPQGKPAPPPAERAAFERQLDAWLAAQSGEPSEAPLRRLNRTEYNNTLRDLTGVDLQPANDFPPDEQADGFDNQSGVQPLPPVLAERYLASAQRVLTAAMDAPRIAPRQYRVTGAELPDGRAGDDGAKWLWLRNGVPHLVPLALPYAGRYRIMLTAYQHPAGTDDAGVSLSAEDSDATTLPVHSRSRAAPDLLVHECRLAAGEVSLALALVNPYADPSNADPHRRYRHALIREVSVEGPLDAEGPRPPTAYRLLGEVPDAAAPIHEKLDAARRCIAAFAGRALRRPPDGALLSRLTLLAGRAMIDGASYVEAVRTAFAAVLVSPGFLFRREQFVSPGVPDDYSLASRLSYLLWSSTPDDRLLAAAADGSLRSTLVSHVVRMIDDPRAESLARDFAGQWLELRNIELSHPDKTLFPEADAALLGDMRHECERLFMHLVRENESVLRVLDAPFSFVNDRLAAHYGWTGVRGGHFRLVGHAEAGRRGLLTTAGVLTLTSQPVRSSPTLRGRFIVENLLGIPPPPPPPNVPALIVAHGPNQPATVAESLVRHRSDKACAACHAAIDPPGIALEEFDALGRRRAVPARPAAPSPLFRDDQLHDSRALLQALSGDWRDAFLHHFAERLLTWALGRRLHRSERLLPGRIVSASARDGWRFHSMIVETARVLAGLN